MYEHAETFLSGVKWGLIVGLIALISYKTFAQFEPMPWPYKEVAGYDTEGPLVIRDETRICPVSLGLIAPIDEFDVDCPDDHVLFKEDKIVVAKQCWIDIRLKGYRKGRLIFLYCPVVFKLWDENEKEIGI